MYAGLRIAPRIASRFAFCAAHARGSHRTDAHYVAHGTLRCTALCMHIALASRIASRIDSRIASHCVVVCRALHPELHLALRQHALHYTLHRDTAPARIAPAVCFAHRALVRTSPHCTPYCTALRATPCDFRGHVLRVHHAPHAADHTRVAKAHRCVCSRSTRCSTIVWTGARSRNLMGLTSLAGSLAWPLSLSQCLVAYTADAQRMYSARAAPLARIAHAGHRPHQAMRTWIHVSVHGITLAAAQRPPGRCA